MLFGAEQGALLLKILEMLKHPLSFQNHLVYKGLLNIRDHTKIGTTVGMKWQATSYCIPETQVNMILPIRNLRQ